MKKANKKRRDKSAQMQISFGMIFSILLIIVFVVFAFFGIKKFMDIQSNILVNKFIDDLDTDMGKMWESSRGSQEVSYNLPKKIQEVCFTEDNKENVYFISKGDFDGGVIDYVNYETTLNDEEEVCFKVENKKVNFVIDKTYGEDSVTISEEGRETAGGSGSSGVGNSGGGSTSGDMVIVYYNNFEQDTLGSYQDEDIEKDWHHGPYPFYKKGHTYIEKDNEDSENPSKHVRVFHKKGTYGGTIPYEDSGVELYQYLGEGYDELYFSYKIKISEGFEYHLTKGKIPSFEGFISREKITQAGECVHGDDDFTASLMFTSAPGGVGIAPYIYHIDMWKNSFNPHMNYERFGDTCEEVEAKLKNEPGYGGVYGSGSPISGLTIETGKWHTVTERVVLNDIGDNNGIVEVYLDDKLYYQRTDYPFRTIEELKINLLSFVSFFGGGEESAVVEDMNFYFDDFIAYYYPDSEGEPNSLSENLPEFPYPSESLTDGSTLTIKGTTNSGSSSIDPSSYNEILNNPDLNILFTNNFEDNHLGKYTSQSEFIGDWKSANGYGDRGNEFETVSDPAGGSNKVGMFTYPFYDSKDFRYVCYGNNACGDSDGKRIYFKTLSEVPQGASPSLLNGVGPGSGGGQWDVDLHGKYDDVYVSYNILVPKEFDAVDGGKFFGGFYKKNIQCFSCENMDCRDSSGKRCENPPCDGIADDFSTRIMFHKGSIGYYVYHSAKGYLCGDPRDITDSGVLYDGEWHNVIFRTKLNQVGSNEGIVEVWIDGEKRNSWEGIEFRKGANTFGIEVLRMSTFYGGDGNLRCTDAQVSSGSYGCSKYSDGTNYYFYAPRKTEHMYVDDIVVYTSK